MMRVKEPIRKTLRLVYRSIPAPKRLKLLLRAVFFRLPFGRLLQQGPSGDYQAWIRLYDELTEEDREQISAHLSSLAYKPLISVVMPVFDTPPKLLRLAIDSVRNQLYPHWELCVADDASSLPSVRPMLDEYARADARIRVVYRERNGHIAAASNSALALARGDYVALMDHDDELSEHALYMVATEVNGHPDAAILYSDSDWLDAAGWRADPFFKPDWDPDLFYGINLMTHLVVFRRELLERIAGFRAGYDGSQDYDLTLRALELVRPDQVLHIPHVLYHWRRTVGSVALAPEAKPYAYAAARKAIQEHLHRRGIAATVTPAYDPYTHRVRYALPGTPPVTILIPTRDQVQLLADCIRSITEKTTYGAYEILVIDNESSDSRTLRFLETAQQDPRIRVIRHEQAFNFSAIVNHGVAEARSDLIVLLNNDTQVITEGWLEEMLSHVLRSEIGVVGSKLYYRDGTVQHAGVILGIGGGAGHPYRFCNRDYSRFGMGRLTQSYSAVTAACMAFRRHVFDEVSGFDEALPVAFNDVDFCLRVREQGYRNLWTPYAELYHVESATRGYDTTPQQIANFEQDKRFMQERWGAALLNDPYHNPNLTLDREDMGLAFPPRVGKPWRRDTEQ